MDMKITVRKVKLAWKYRKPLWKYRALIRRRKQIAGIAGAGAAAFLVWHFAARSRG
jgi:hypothetical protein